MKHSKNVWISIHCFQKRMLILDLPEGFFSFRVDAALIYVILHLFFCKLQSRAEDANNWLNAFRVSKVYVGALYKAKKFAWVFVSSTRTEKKLKVSGRRQCACFLRLGGKTQRRLSAFARRWQISNVYYNFYWLSIADRNNWANSCKCFKMLQIKCFPRRKAKVFSLLSDSEPFAIPKVNCWMPAILSTL